MENNLKSVLACPNCRSNLIEKSSFLKCEKCKRIYKIEDGVPIFIENPLAGEELATSELKKKIMQRRWLNRLKNIISAPETNEHARNGLKNEITKNALVLNLGSSSKKVYRNTINLDIGKFSNVDVVADGKKLPFKDNSFDVVLIETVLEHVDEPEIVIREAYRVVKKKGFVYISIPFVFIFHGSPEDYNRYTIKGLVRRIRLAGFNNIKAGILSGPGSTMSQILRYYLALLFCFNSDVLFSILLNLFGWLTFPIKYTDRLLNRYKKSHVLANMVWATGQK